MNFTKTKRNESVPVHEAKYFTIIVNEDEINVIGYNDEKKAKDLLDDRFQKSLPEELTMEYLENTYEGMKENLSEHLYVDIDDFEGTFQKYSDAKNRNFDYLGGYTDGSYAYYMPEETKLVNGEMKKIYEFGMIGRVFKRTDFDGRYIVLWNDETDINQVGFKSKEDADNKLKKIFMCAVPNETIIGIREQIEKMEVDEREIGLMDDAAFCTLSNPVFNAIILDIGITKSSVA